MLTKCGHNAILIKINSILRFNPAILSLLNNKVPINNN